MYLCGDIGGTKTLLASFSDAGELIDSVRFATSQDYDEFLQELAFQTLKLGKHDYRAASMAFPGTIDREEGVGKWFGNLPWKNVKLQADIERLFECPVIIENDAKAGGLSEAKIFSDFNRVLYVAIGTGIGVSLIIDGVISTAIGDSGGHDLLLEYDGKTQAWEGFASGKAIVKQFGKEAREIKDVASWKKIARNIALGLRDLVAMTEPEAVIIGGGVGVHFSKFGKLLEEELKQYKTPMTNMPVLLKAKNPDEAVLYGAYLLAKERYGSR